MCLWGAEKFSECPLYLDIGALVVSPDSCRRMRKEHNCGAHQSGPSDERGSGTPCTAWTTHGAATTLPRPKDENCCCSLMVVLLQHPSLNVTVLCIDRPRA